MERPSPPHSVSNEATDPSTYTADQKDIGRDCEDGLSR